MGNDMNKKRNGRGRRRKRSKTTEKTVRAFLFADVRMPKSENNHILKDIRNVQTNLTTKIALVAGRPPWQLALAKPIPDGWQAWPVGRQAANPAKQSDENGRKTRKM